MPEREYFSFRYAIPGYTFLLLIVAVNYVPILRFLEIIKVGEVFGAFLAFLSLFAGAALGFLVSQLWYWWFSRNNLFLREIEPMEEELKNKFGFKAPQRTKDKEIAMGTIMDYIGLTECDKIWTYAQRRWDIYHVLSSTFLTLIIGWVVGTIFRIYYEFFLFNASFKICGNSGFWAEFLAQLFVFFCVVILLSIIYIGKHEFMNEYRLMFKALIRNSEREKELKRGFSEYFAAR